MTTDSVTDRVYRVVPTCLAGAVIDVWPVAQAGFFGTDFENGDAVGVAATAFAGSFQSDFTIRVDEPDGVFLGQCPDEEALVAFAQIFRGVGWFVGFGCLFLAERIVFVDAATGTQCE
ncbi:MAG: hypothetical protein CVU21_24235 [Betaproteobacteria bacterium HGW-Betaproteobacteria-15]|nr:MAG: hypothetical protein CVU21_24235 [Betaproteobacteria bacterium HGW-Betaproteobacteria-15]